MMSTFLENKMSLAGRLREVISPGKNLQTDLDSIVLDWISLLYRVPSQEGLTTTRHVKLSLHSSLVDGDTLWRWVVCKVPPINNKSPLYKGVEHIVGSPSFLSRKFLGAPIDSDNIGTTSRGEDLKDPHHPDAMSANFGQICTNLYCMS